jgi:YopJ Serine/Threonine acetyltransferase
MVSVLSKLCLRPPDSPRAHGAEPGATSPAPGAAGAPAGQRRPASSCLPVRAATASLTRGTRALLPPRRRDPGIPSEKLFGKSQQVADLLSKTPVGPNDPSFSAYAKDTVTLARQNTQPGDSTTEADIAHLGKMIEVENQRNPGLNLTQHATPADFIDHLQAAEPGRFRAIFPLADPDGQPTWHHVMADVHKQAGQPTTVLICEPADLNGDQGKMHVRLWEAMHAEGIDTSRVGVIEARTQASPNDCVMFSLNCAIKSHKNKDQFDQMHASLQNREGLMPGQNNYESFATFSATALHAAHTGERAENLFIGHQTDFAPGMAKLPADFYKHANSSGAIGMLGNERAFGRMRRENGLEPPSARVNSRQNHGANAVTLAERHEAYKVTRHPPEKPGGVTYSASIEGFRLQEIARVLQASQGDAVATSKVSTVRKENLPPAD